MTCEDHVQLEALVKYLVDQGLCMTREDKFADFVMLHARHNLSLPCEWLDYDRRDDEAFVKLKDVEPSFEFDWPLGYEGPGWISSPGRGFVIERGEEHEVWLDFLTGHTVIRFPMSRLPRGAPLT